MKKAAPEKIERPKHYLLHAEWKDGFESTIKLKDLRDECPCATCNEDEFHQKSNPMSALGNYQPGRNDLKKLQPVGNYAVASVWGDGHNTGIYPWELFRDIFEKHKLSDEDLKELEAKNPSKPLPQLKVRGNN